jgi:hypothetical protein
MPRSRGTRPCMPRSPRASRSIRARVVQMRWCALWLRRPPCTRALGAPPPLPAQPQNRPTRHAPAYKRAGALHLVAACDTRAGTVYGHCYDRKRQRECMAFVDALALESEERVRTIHLVCDHVSTPHGQEVQQWVTHPPRVVMHFTPVHGSWRNQVAQWFSILQRQRVRSIDVESKDPLDAKIRQFIHAWNHQAHPFNWSTQSGAKVMAAAPALAA